jgi:hypothetical protein
VKIFDFPLARFRFLPQCPVVSRNTPPTKTMKKYSYYLPLISRKTGSKFVWQGAYTELADGTILLPSGEECEENKSFPN